MPVKLLAHSRYSAINSPLHLLIWSGCLPMFAALFLALGSVLLEVRSLNSWQQDHLGACQKCGTTSPAIPGLRQKFQGGTRPSALCAGRSPPGDSEVPWNLRTTALAFVSFHLTPEHVLMVLQGWLLSEKVILTKLNGFTTHSFY